LCEYHEEKHIYIFHPVLITHINADCYCGVEVRSRDWTSNQNDSENCECYPELAECESVGHINRVEEKCCAHEFIKEHNQLVILGRVDFH